MKTRLIYTLVGIALMLTLPAEVRATIPLKPNSNAPEYSKRIQPAAAEYYDYELSGRDKDIPYYHKFDIYGNSIYYYRENADGYKNYLFTTWDNSKGYPVKLDSYDYTVNPDGQEGETTYWQRTTLDASGVRTALYIRGYDDIPLDAAGHVLSYEQVSSYDKTVEGSTMKWDGDRLTAFAYHYSHDNDGQIDINLTNVDLVCQTRPFNAYELEYYDMLNESGKSGIWINADVTGTWTGTGDTYSGTMTIRTEVSADKKTLTKTVKIGDKRIRLDKMVYTDDNGSYTLYTEEDKSYLGSEAVYTYNAYGDLIQDASRFDLTKARINLYEWQYDADGRPLQVERYQKTGLDGEKTLKEKITFTAWHDGSSISTTEAGEARILGATLYTVNGMKVRTLTAEEAQAVDAVTVPQRGVYLMVLHTERGMQTRKVVL